MLSNLKLQSVLTMLVVMITVSLIAGCGAGYRTTTINGVKTLTYVDDAGHKKDIYQIDKDGSVTIYDKNDPKAQQLLKEQAAADERKKAQAERIDRIKKAKKRSAKDPIYVALYETKLDDTLKGAEKSKGAVFKQIRKELEGDRIIRLVDQRKLKKDVGREITAFMKKPVAPESTIADVRVVSKGYIQEKVGISRKTGKPAKMTAVVFEATVQSNFLPQTYTVKESGHILKNPEVTRRFAEKIRTVIVQKIGPNIPKDRSL